LREREREREREKWIERERDEEKSCDRSSLRPIYKEGFHKNQVLKYSAQKCGKTKK
jgi:regulator of replication initiation timing